LEKDGKIALRIPNYPLVQALLKSIDRPLTATSANVSGKPSCESAIKAMKQFEKQEYRPHIVVNAGILPKSKASTIIDITDKVRKVLRK
jgi:L-threonylcarbamoyladenylate synthase